MARRFSRRTPRAGKGVLKNKFEAKLAELLKAQWGTVNTEYEKTTLTYAVNETRKYTPDFKHRRKQLYVEGKGRFTFQDRKKMLLVKQQHPDKDVRLFFASGDKPLYKGSKTTYGEWADKNGFKWTDSKRGLPSDW